MKYAIVLIAALALALPCHGQDLPDYTSKKNELNIGYFNLFNLMGTNTLGVGYKRSGNIGAFRVGTGFGLALFSEEGNNYDGSNNGFSIYPRIGYEFHKWIKRFRVQYGADIAAGYSKYSRESNFPEGDSYWNQTATTKTFAIRPLLGVGFFIHPSISVSTEVYLDVSWSAQEIERFDNGDVQSNTNSGMNTSLSPLGIVSVNFHF